MIKFIRNIFNLRYNAGMTQKFIICDLEKNKENLMVSEPKNEVYNKYHNMMKIGKFDIYLIEGDDQDTFPIISTFPPNVENPTAVYIDAGYCDCTEQEGVYVINGDSCIKNIKKIFESKKYTFLYKTIDNCRIIKEWSEILELLKGRHIYH
ncbi:UNVERIFIED_ORG: hypothetical protein B2H98_08235 [Clostridium botulinum]